MTPGSLLAFSGQGIVSRFIDFITYSAGVSHVGVIARHRGRLKLFESTYEDGVQAVKIGQRVERYIGKVWLYPLSRPLYEHEDERLSDFLTGLIGTKYDLPGALKAAGYLTAKFKASATKPNLSTAFCSELVAAAHSHIGMFPTCNPSRWSPNTLIRAERRAGILQTPERLK